jgi:hypothetical protein
VRKKELTCALFNFYLCPMKQVLTALVGVILSTTVASSQISYLDRPDLLEKVEHCLQHTYGFSFGEARSIQRELSHLTPGHPAPVFLEALIVYWENFPLLPSEEASKEFTSLMDLTIDLAKTHTKNDQFDMEGVFFDLYGRAFKAMFWADNGRSGKVIPDLGTMYRHTKKGFELQEQFVEFYFSTGLYNYYIEAYPKAHPAYKPLLSFMHKGDRDLGLKQLNYAIEHTVFLKVESIFFMSLIQLNYEEDLNTASMYAEKLVRDYPGNIYFQGHLINILLHQHRFDRVRDLLLETAQQEDRYSEMIRTLASAFMAENMQDLNYQAGTAYMLTIEMADTFGPFADIYKAMGYMGLSRMNEKMDLQNEADKYARKASHFTSYSFILEEQSSGSR